MRARLTFLDKVRFNFGGGAIVWSANVQGCTDRSNWSLGFRSDIQLTDLVFEGEVKWLTEPHQHGLVTGAKFQYVNPENGSAFALGVVL